MDASLGVSLQILCFSIVPTALPMPDPFTMDLVTGKWAILESNSSKKSSFPEEILLENVGLWRDGNPTLQYNSQRTVRSSKNLIEPRFDVREQVVRKKVI